MAIGNRKPGAGLLLHSDRGDQCICCDYQQMLTNHPMNWQHEPAR